MQQLTHPSIHPSFLPCLVACLTHCAGSVPDGLVVFPDGNRLAYPLGSTVVLKSIKGNSQSFLQGHTDRVTCLALSGDGSMLASGQVTSMGFKACVIVWDTASGSELYRLELHKVKVQSLSFSPDGAYLATLGGPDDNNLVVWDMSNGKAICGSPASSHAAVTVRWFNNSSAKLMTGGQYNLRIWDFDRAARKLRPTDCHLGQLKRNINTILIDSADRFAYCGTQTGDLLEVNVSNGRFARASRQRFSLGIQCLAYQLDSSGKAASIICGNGDGTVAHLTTDKLAVVKAVQVMGAVRSLSLAPDERNVYVGTGQGNTYRLELGSMKATLLGTAHYSGITDVCFPSGCSELFVTCSKNDIRVWNTVARSELLRIQVPNLVCNCIAVLPNGKSIVSGWDDGKIRAFFPESGKLQYVITDAHAEAVTAVACTHDNTRLVSGGKDGRVRVWNIEGRTQTMELSFKEHKGKTIVHHGRAMAPPNVT